MSHTQVKVQDSERIDAEDVRFLTNAPLESAKALTGALMTPQSPQELNFVNHQHSWVLGGFQPIVDPVVNTAVHIDRGSAILAMNDAGQVTQGVPFSEGDDYKILDLLGKPAGYYSIWIRFELADGGFANRIFWDPSAGAEFAQNIATRRIANWGMTVVRMPQLTNPPASPNNKPAAPGSEWLYVGYAHTTGVGPITVVPQRVLYFEGNEAAGYNGTWGGGNDRDPDRSTYGVKDFRTFAQAVLTRLSEIEGSDWFNATPEALNLKVGRLGDLLPFGTYKFDGTTGDTFTFAGGLDAVKFLAPLDVRGSFIAGAGPVNVGSFAHPFKSFIGQGISLFGDSAGSGAKGSIVSQYAHVGTSQGVSFLRDDDAGRGFQLIDDFALGTSLSQKVVNLLALPSMDAIALTVADTQQMVIENGVVRFRGSVLPTVANSQLLGVGGLEWSEMHAVTAYASEIGTIDFPVAHAYLPYLASMSEMAVDGDLIVDHQTGVGTHSNAQFNVFLNNSDGTIGLDSAHPGTGTNGGFLHVAGGITAGWGLATPNVSTNQLINDTDFGVAGYANNVGEHPLSTVRMDVLKRLRLGVSEANDGVPVTGAFTRGLTVQEDSANTPLLRLVHNGDADMGSRFNPTVWLQFDPPAGKVSADGGSQGALVFQTGGSSFNQGIKLTSLVLNDVLEIQIHKPTHTIPVLVKNGNGSFEKRWIWLYDTPNPAPYST